MTLSISIRAYNAINHANYLFSNCVNYLIKLNLMAKDWRFGTVLGVFPTKETCFLYLYTCYLDEDYVPRYARNFVLYELARLACKILKLSQLLSLHGFLLISAIE